MKISGELQEAVVKFQQGEMSSFEQIYELSYKYLHTCVIHVVKDENIAMDMLQETYLEISKSIMQLKNTEDFLGWAAIIANRKCFAYLKKNKDVLLYDEAESEDERDSLFDQIADDEAFIPEEILQNKEKQRLMREIIDSLSDVQRLCIIGYYYNGQKQEKIAEELGIPVNTVKTHLCRAKSRIKAAVIDLDVKKGTRLYSLAPFMALLFKEEMQACMIKPMSAALAAGLKASGIKPGVMAKLKSLCTKMTAVGKGKVAAGVVVCAVATATAVTVMKEPEETYIVSEDLQTTFDEILHICEQKEFEKLCDMDFVSYEAPYLEMTENYEYWQWNAFLDYEGKRITDTVFYDGDNGKLVSDYTGYGIGIQGSALTIGNFKRGKIEGDVVNIYIKITYIIDGEKEIPRQLIQVSTFCVEGDEIVGEVADTWWHDDKLYTQYTGNVAFMNFTEEKRNNNEDRSGGEYYVFTGKVNVLEKNYHYTEDEWILQINEHAIYLDENGHIDREKNIIADKGEYEVLLDEKGGTDWEAIPNLYIGGYKLAIPFGKEYLR